MKKISMLLLVLSAVIIAWFFIKEQFNGIVLSGKENRILSITYLVTGISLFILYRMKRSENKNQEEANK